MIKKYIKKIILILFIVIFGIFFIDSYMKTGVEEDFFCRYLFIFMEWKLEYCFFTSILGNFS